MIAGVLVSLVCVLVCIALVKAAPLIAILRAVSKVRGPAFRFPSG